MITYPYPKPGDKLPAAKPHLFDLAARKEVPVPDELFPNPWELRVPHWLPDGSAWLRDTVEGDTWARRATSWMVTGILRALP